MNRTPLLLTLSIIMILGVILTVFVSVRCMKRIIISGKIGSGKSTVCKLFGSKVTRSNKF